MSPFPLLPVGMLPLTSRTRLFIAGTVVAALCAVMVATSRAHAQSPPTRPDSSVAGARSALDSLAARLGRAEADLALLRQQVATEASAQVRLRSRLRLGLYARLLANVYYTSGEANNPEVPIIARAASVSSAKFGSPGSNAMGLSVRQTTMGGSVSVDSVIGAQFTTDFEVDFFGGFGADGPPLFPTPRLRTARGFLQWSKTELMVGAESPLISDLNPVGVAAIGTPDFAGAGNLWNWLPQVRVTRELGVWRRGEHALHMALQGAIIDPRTGDRHVAESNGVDAGIRSARPAVEGRVRGQWGVEHEPTTTQRIGDRGGEIGLGAHRGWLRISGDTLVSSWAVSVDARVGLSHGIELRGEAYRGRMLRGLGGGGIGQNFAPSTLDGNVGASLTDVAGWVQLNYQLRPTVMTGAGCGTDRVENGQPLRQRNSSCAAHVEWRPTSPVLFGMEYRGIATRGTSGRQRVTHFNLFFGVEL